MNKWSIKIYEDGDVTRLSGFASIEFLERARELITQTIEQQEEDKNHDKRTIH
nr:MAG TPA: hypothetical protein [Caudoviricetes sp.]